MTTTEERTVPTYPCFCRGNDPADPCGHGDTSEGCPKHDKSVRAEYDENDPTEANWDYCAECAGYGPITRLGKCADCNERLDALAARGPAPKVGEPYKRTEAEVIVPTYVRESLAPAPGGACVTADYTKDAADFDPAGWYVEFHYPEKSESYRTFIPFQG